MEERWRVREESNEDVWRKERGIKERGMRIVGGRVEG